MTFHWVQSEDLEIHLMVAYLLQQETQAHPTSPQQCEDVIQLPKVRFKQSHRIITWFIIYLPQYIYALLLFTLLVTNGSSNSDEHQRKRKSRWGATDTKINIPGLPTAISSSMTKEQREQYSGE
jgi:hypothetical protein